MSRLQWRQVFRLRQTVGTQESKETARAAGPGRRTGDALHLVERHVVHLADRMQADGLEQILHDDVAAAIDPMVQHRMHRFGGINVSRPVSTLRAKHPEIPTDLIGETFVM